MTDVRHRLLLMIVMVCEIWSPLVICVNISRCAHALCRGPFGRVKRFRGVVPKILGRWWAFEFL